MTLPIWKSTGENNRIEAKKAQGGLPHSIWETYSAFANSFGGVLLLGVAEDADRRFVTVPLSSPERLVREFWSILNDRTRVSANILSEQDVRIVESGGNRIVVIQIPRAGTPRTPCLYRNGSLHRLLLPGRGGAITAAVRTRCAPCCATGRNEPQDALVLEELSEDCFDPGCVSRYRILLADLHPAPAWQRSIAEHFLPCIGAVAKGSDGQYHPTAAGLLMFGKEPAIRREFPDYLLDYQELDDAGSLVYQLSSRSGDWSGSLFDFYFLVFRRLLPGIGRKGPEALVPSGSDAVRAALSEALGNCLIHADYRAKSGLSIRKEPESIVIANPRKLPRRHFRSDGRRKIRSEKRHPCPHVLSHPYRGTEKAAASPASAGPGRNRAGEAPVLTEQLSPARITLTLRLKRGERERAGSSVQKARRQAILEYLTAVPEAYAAQIARAVGLSASRTGGYLRALLKEDILIRKRAGRKLGHNEAITPDDRPPLRGRSAIDRHALAKCRIVSDFSRRDFAFKLQILRYTGDNGTRKDSTIVSQPRSVEDIACG